MRVLSAFAGIEGFGRGFEQASPDFDIVGQIEWDRSCQKVLEHHYPGKLVGEDICDVSGSQVRDQLGLIDLACGGFPCQEISIAGPAGSGLAGARSGEFYSFTRLTGEYLELVDSLGPRWVAFENTDALLTSPRPKAGEDRPPRGSDMAAVIEGLVDLGYGVGWRVVDGRYFGSPQRRSRLIVLGHLGGDPRPAWQVLGDPDTGGRPADPRAERRYKRGPKAVAGAADGSGVLTFRKSANPRMSLEKGGYQTWVPEDGYNTLTGFDWGGPTRQKHLIIQNGRIRANTLLEWERLMTFPDHWTNVPGVSDSARGQMLGNAFMPSMGEWLGRRIKAVHDSLYLHPALTAAK